MNRRGFLGIAGTTAAVAGCVTVPGASGEPTGTEVLESAIETRIELTDLAARRVLESESDDRRHEHVERIERRPPGERRTVVVASDDEETPAGFLSVTNRERTWEHNPRTDEIDLRHHPNRVVAEGPRLALEALRDQYELQYEGTESIDGRTAHRVEATPSDQGTDVRSIDLAVGETVYQIPLESVDQTALEDARVDRTLWIDVDREYPLRERDAVRTADDELRHRLTVTYENLQIDQGLDDDRFSYEPPDDASVTDAGTEAIAVVDSRAAAVEQAPYPLPDPAFPDPYELDRVTVVPEPAVDGTRTTFWAQDPARPHREVFVAVRDEQRVNTDVLEPITVDGEEAYRRDGRIESVFWDCGGRHFEVSSPSAVETPGEIAEQIGCR